MYIAHVRLMLMILNGAILKDSVYLPPIKRKFKGTLEKIVT